MKLNYKNWQLMFFRFHEVWMKKPTCTFSYGHVQVGFFIHTSRKRNNQQSILKWTLVRFQFEPLQEVVVWWWIYSGENIENFLPEKVWVNKYASTLFARSFRRRFFVYHHAVKHLYTCTILSWLSIPLVLKCAAKILKIGLQIKILCPKMSLNRVFA